MSREEQGFWNPSVHRIDGVNFVERDVPWGEGSIHLCGMTVRALKKALEGADPDDLVVYMAEQVPESRDAQLLVGVIGGLMTDGNCGTSFLVGPEAVRGLKAMGAVK